MVGCANNQAAHHEPQASDTLYTTEAGATFYDKKPEKVFVILDTTAVDNWQHYAEMSNQLNKQWQEIWAHEYALRYQLAESNEAYDQAKLEELVGNVIRTLFDEPKRYTADDQVGNALYTAVVDTQTDRVIYFNSVLSNADHPLSRGNVNSQMKRLLKKFN